MGLKNIVVLNDEAHHCYREKPGDAETTKTSRATSKDEAEKNNEAARLWITGLEAVKRKLGVARVYRPVRDAVLPARLGLRRRHAVPLDDERLLADGRHRVRHRQAAARAGRRQRPGGEMPMFRNLWEHIGKEMPKKGAGKAGELDPLNLPTQLQTALDALYGHYAEDVRAVARAGIGVPPVFIVVCNNTATSKLVYDYISGFQRQNDDGSTTLRERPAASCSATSTTTATRSPARNTLLIDSEQLESGEALDEEFREMAADEIEQFRREIVERDRRRRAPATNITDADLLREVMNTVGKKGRLGEPIRCVVSVSC